jgi:hypothetical protein
MLRDVGRAEPDGRCNTQGTVLGEYQLDPKHSYQHKNN